MRRPAGGASAIQLSLNCPGSAGLGIQSPAQLLIARAAMSSTVTLSVDGNDGGLTPLTDLPGIEFLSLPTAPETARGRVSLRCRTISPPPPFDASLDLPSPTEEPPPPLLVPSLTMPLNSLHMPAPTFTLPCRPISPPAITPARDPPGADFAEAAATCGAPALHGEGELRAAGTRSVRRGFRLPPPEELEARSIRPPPSPPPARPPPRPPRPAARPARPPPSPPPTRLGRRAPPPLLAPVAPPRPPSRAGPAGGRGALLRGGAAGQHPGALLERQAAAPERPAAPLSCSALPDAAAACRSPPSPPPQCSTPTGRRRGGCGEGGARLAGRLRPSALRSSSLSPASSPSSSGDERGLHIATPPFRSAALWGPDAPCAPAGPRRPASPPAAREAPAGAPDEAPGI
eukprot:tig00000670_g3036.t1